MRGMINTLAGLLLTVYSLTALAVPVALTEEGGVADFPGYLTDAGGNLHLVWHDASVDSGAVFYELLDASDNELIPGLQVNSGGTGNANSWPSISVDAAGLAFVVWQNADDNEVHFMRLNPALAPLDGTATTAATIREIEQPLSPAGGADAIHPRIRRDSNGDLHVVWESSGGGPVQYVKIDVDGVVLNGPVSLGGTSNGSALPDVDVDTAGNIHIVFGNAAATTANEVFYAMVDGASGAVLIDATLLTVDDGLRAGSATVNVDTYDDTLYIVFKQALMPGVNGVEDIFMARLDPSLDDQNGDAADPAILKVSERQITDGEGLFQWHVTSRITSDKRIHATYIDFDNSACPGHPPYTVTDAHITFAGTVLARDVLTTTGAATGCFPQARSAPGRKRIVWADSTTPGISEIHASTISRADAGSRGFLSCSLGKPDSRSAGELWLLMGLLWWLYRRYRRALVS